MVLRSVPLYSDRYGLSGRSDAIEVSRRRHGRASWVKDEIQPRRGRRRSGMRPGVVPRGDGRAHRGVRFRLARRPTTASHVDFTDRLRSLTVAAVEEIRASLVSGRLPLGVADERCRECQLEPVCLPDVLARSGGVRAYVEKEVLRCE